jgi:hypothetical protein
MYLKLRKYVKLCQVVLHFQYLLAKLQGIIVQFVSCYGPFCLVPLSLVQFCYPVAGTESELSFGGRESQRRLLRQARPGQPLKIAAINGKHKGHRYLSKECKWTVCF